MGKIEYSTAFLLSGMDLEIADGMIIKHPKLKDILSLGYGYQCDAEYWMYVSSILCNPYEYMVELDDEGLDYRNFSSFDIFVWRWEKNQGNDIFATTLMQSALSFFFGEGFYYFDQSSPDELFLLNKENPKFSMDKLTFNYVIEFIEQIHCIDHSSEIHPRDNHVYGSLVDMHRRRKKRKRRSEESKYNNIIGIMQLILATMGVIPLAEQPSRGIYSLLKLGSAVRKKEEVGYIKYGIYSGNIDSNAVSESIFNWFE